MSLNVKFEVTKDLQETALDAVEKARVSGKIKKGSNEATKAIERGIAKLVIVAEDVNPIEVVMHIPILCEEKKIACIPIKSKSEVGAAAGLNVPCSAIAVIEAGEAKELIDSINKKVLK